MFFKKRKKISAEESLRKERSDKKVHVGPTVSIYLKREIERLADIVDIPIKEVAEMLCYHGIRHEDMSHLLGQYVQKGGIHVNNTVYLATKNKPSLAVPRDSHHPTDRISIRFPREEYEGKIELLAYHLGVTPSRATAILLDFSIRHHPTVELILARNIERSFSEEMEEDLKKLMYFINRKNPFKTTWHQRLLDIIRPPKKKKKQPIDSLPKEAIDTESYKWSYD